MKTHLLTLLLIPAAYAEPTVLFSPATEVTFTQPTTVTGPLVQLELSGSTLSFQHGSVFHIEGDTITLTRGNLRIGPAGDTPLTLKLPTGTATLAPRTALTLTTENNQTSGRIYSGSLTTGNRTFTTTQGFQLTATGAHGTFTPAAAQAPAYLNLAALEPAAGPTQATTPPTPQPSLLAANTPSFQPPAQPQPEQTQQPESPQPTPEIQQPEPKTDQPEPKTETPTQEPETQQPEPEPEIQQPETKTEQPEPKTETPTPQPEIQQPEPPEQTPEVPQPEPDLPTTQLRSNLIAAFGNLPDTVDQPDNHTTRPLAFTMGTYRSGLQQLEATQANIIGSQNLRILRNTATQADVANVGPAQAPVAGLGRWVGGSLVTLTGRTASPRAETLPNPASVHYVWGEKPTAIPTTGRITYTLAAATQPTYTGSTNLPGTGTFNGNLDIDFAPLNSSIGTYHFSGTVTMPHTTWEDGLPATSTQTYTFSTAPNGAQLYSDIFHNPATLAVTATPGAAACPTGSCTGTVNAAGFGPGMATVGTLYTLNPGTETGITGAALFTANPPTP